MPPTFAAAPQCATCSRAVYFAEQQVGPGGKVYHKGCLRCQSCSKTLDALGLLDHDGEPYCKPCHGKSFGAKGYGVGTALVGEYTDRIASPLATSPFRPRASPFATPTKVDAPETAKFSVSSAHSLTGSPAGSPRWATSAGTPTYGKVPGSAGSLMRDGERTAPSPKYGSGGDLCRRCQTVVYFAESVLAVGQKWHKRCLRCAQCETSLSSNLSEREGLPYCKKCYGESFGAQAHGLMSRPGMF